ncbi:MAG: NTP transferase domain-containing protein [Rhodospirillales bacterium]|jgi:spore coat polysaccharide biosynthesis protein SpsF|nr:NTP transferase domain-containing protein [Rhodospirillales bacterium]HIJ93313.1 NTP transferase domain-containing protein [Rhodospirillaceae bacterium]HJP55302.1 NTP transferase domain-containing protein [Rhodospirillales bacterium]
MDILGLIQCRMSSARLPRKAAEDLSGRPVIEWVIGRAKRAGKLDKVVVATSKSVEDDWLREKAESHGLEAIRGSLDDVLSRYVTALQRFPARAVVRITGDNPLTDPGLVDGLVDHFNAERPDYAYVARAPYGAATDIFDAESLLAAAAATSSERHREHINTAFLDRYFACRITSFAPPLAMRRPDVRLTLDDQSDLERLREIFKRLPDPLSASLEEVIAAHDGLPYELKAPSDQ